MSSSANPRTFRPRSARPGSALTGLVAAALLLGTGTAGAASYRIDPARTQIAFAIGAKGYPMTRGEFRRFTAKLAVDAAAPSRSHVAFDVAAASIDTHSPLLNDYVRAPGFLDTAHHPGIAFRSTSVRKVDDHTVELTGNLTLLGVTRPQSFRVTVTPADAAGYRLVAEGDIRRSDFGMTGGSPMVADIVTITVSTVAVDE